MEIIKLYAEWCGPCKVMEETLVNLGIEHKSIDIDSEEGEEYVSEFKIRSIPALLKFENGKFVDKLIGSQSTDKIKEFCYGNN